jgi:Cof subfamily protein (haloacid dehalogenase superfamily)
MPKPVICLDFDGTLINHDGVIHPRDVEILTTEQRVIFIPATGRLLHAVRHAFEQNDLFVGQPIPLPLVLQNGAVLYEAGEVLHASNPFEPDVQRRLIATAQSHPAVTFFLFSVDYVAVISPSEVAMAMADGFGLNTQPYQPDDERQITKVMCIAEDAAHLRAVADAIADLPLERAFSLPTVLEINAPGVNKGLMMGRLLEEMGWAQARIAAAGDGENDLPLFELAELSFSPHTSPEGVRSQADHVIDTRETGLLAPILTALGFDPE